MSTVISHFEVTLAKCSTGFLLTDHKNIPFFIEPSPLLLFDVLGFLLWQHPGQRKGTSTHKPVGQSQDVGLATREEFSHQLA